MRSACLPALQWPRGALPQARARQADADLPGPTRLLPAALARSRPDASISSADPHRPNESPPLANPVTLGTEGGRGAVNPRPIPIPNVVEGHYPPVGHPGDDERNVDEDGLLSMVAVDECKGARPRQVLGGIEACGGEETDNFAHPVPAHGLPPCLDRRYAPVLVLPIEWINNHESPRVIWYGCDCRCDPNRGTSVKRSDL